MLSLVFVALATTFDAVSQSFTQQNGCATPLAHMDMTNISECHFSHFSIIRDVVDPDLYPIVYSTDTDTYYRTGKNMTELETRCTKDLPMYPTRRRLQAYSDPLYLQYNVPPPP